MAENTADDDEHILQLFSNPEAIARYAEGPRRFVPGLDALHRMTGVLLAEKTPRDARVLVLGAGGGMELRALAEDYPNWSFVGVDPAAAMLQQAERTLGDLIARVELVQGYVDDAPLGPFDAGACLLTLHFLDTPERQRTLREIHRRLRPGSPFVAAHGSFPQTSPERSLWLDRYVAYAIASGVDPEQARAARKSVETKAITLSPEEDEAVLRNSGFRDAQVFYSAFTLRGWIGHA